MSNLLVKEDVAQKSAIGLGFWAALLLAILAAIAFALGITTPPRSGPYCTGDCIAYPFTDAARFVPRDYRWVIPAILLIPVFVIVSACIHSLVPATKRHLSLIGLCFASIAAGIIGIDYFIQFQVLEPSLLHGETVGLVLFSQYNPRGFFIALEDLGYLTLCVAFGFAGASFPRTRRSFIGMTWRFGLDIEYRFEVAIITITWMTLLVVGVMLSFFFRKPRDDRKAPLP